MRPRIGSAGSSCVDLHKLYPLFVNKLPFDKKNGTHMTSDKSFAATRDTDVLTLISVESNNHEQ